jgi:hypothetical protein
MAEETITTTGIAVHGASRLPSVEIDSFNIELKDEEGIPWRPSKQRRIPGNSRPVAEAAAQIGRRPVRDRAIRKHQQEGA